MPKVAPSATAMQFESEPAGAEAKTSTGQASTSEEVLLELAKEHELPQKILDFRGTLSVSKDAPVGFTAIRVEFELDSDASDEDLSTLLRLTERYCVVGQTLTHSPSLSFARA